MPPQYCVTTDRVCLQASGADATAFLHAQLSQSIADLGFERAPLAGWHDARGRVRALFRVIRLPDRWLLLTERDGADTALRRLRMFVLRSAVTLDVAADIGCGAVLGADSAWHEAHDVQPAMARDAVVERGDVRWLHAGGALWLALGPTAVIDALEPRLPRAAPAALIVAEIALGIPAVTAALADKYVAQMLNLDELGALAFDKGCYPGQEVIARVHNLGSVKRRLRRYGLPVAPPPTGAAVASADGTAAGEVVRAAATVDGCELLALIDHAAADAPLFCAGRELRALPLPFAVSSR